MISKEDQLETLKDNVFTVLETCVKGTTSSGVVTDHTLGITVTIKKKKDTTNEKPDRRGSR